MEEKHEVHMDHFVSEFCENLKDELEDILEDNKLYEELKAAGMHGEAKTMEEIANDEYSHAKAYRSMLEKHGHPMSEEVKGLWEKVESVFEVM